MLATINDYIWISSYVQEQGSIENIVVSSNKIQNYDVDLCVPKTKLKTTNAGNIFQSLLIFLYFFLASFP